MDENESLFNLYPIILYDGGIDTVLTQKYNPVWYGLKNRVSHEGYETVPYYLHSAVMADRVIWFYSPTIMGIQEEVRQIANWIVDRGYPGQKEERKQVKVNVV